VSRRRKKHFIKAAIQHPGVEREAAQRAGKSTAEYAEEHKHDSGTSGNRARLALTLMHLNRPKQVAG
jgi:hypothetical protein